MKVAIECNDCGKELHVALLPATSAYNRLANLVIEMGWKGDPSRGVVCPTCLKLNAEEAANAALQTAVRDWSPPGERGFQVP